MKRFEYKIYEQVFLDMVSKKKDVEIRLLNDKSSQIEIGDVIRFKVIDGKDKAVEVKVVDLMQFKDVDELWDKRSFNILSDVKSKEALLDIMYQIFGKELVDTHKILAIKFEILEVFG